MAPAHLWLAKLYAADNRDPDLARKHEMLARQYAPKRPGAAD
jgi:hypothetical protein